jgi:molybdate transport system permease protein
MNGGRWGVAALLVGPTIYAALIVGVVAALAGRLPFSVLWAALASQEAQAALRLSLWTSVAALAVAAVIALPGGLALARFDFPGKGVLSAVLEAPLFMPPLAAGVGLLFLFGPRMLGDSLARWGIELLFTPAGVVTAQSFAAVATLLPAARGAFAAVDRRYAETAATLRASPWDAFWSVEARLALPGLAAGAVSAWGRAISEFGATLMLAGAARGRTETLPMATFLNIATGETATAVACAMILLIVSLAAPWGVRLVAGRKRQFD